MDLLGLNTNLHNRLGADMFYNYSFEQAALAG